MLGRGEYSVLVRSELSKSSMRSCNTRGGYFVVQHRITPFCGIVTFLPH